MKIKNWNKFQHFKDRRPPWIKLYRDILDDPEWFSLKDKEARLLVHLWLLASEDKTKTGTIPDVKTISFRLRISEKEIEQGLKALSGWLYQDDDTLISTRHQGDTPETETEKKKEREKKKATKVAYRVIDYLNKKTGKNFRKIESNIKLINGRLSEGFKEEDFYLAIDNKVLAWTGDSKMEQHLVPATLFGKKKFDGYVNSGGGSSQENTCQLCSRFCAPSSPDKCHKSATIKACVEFAAR